MSGGLPEYLGESFERNSISIGTTRGFLLKSGRETESRPPFRRQKHPLPEKVWFQPPQLLGHGCVSTQESFSGVAAPGGLT